MKFEIFVSFCPKKGHTSSTSAHCSRRRHARCACHPCSPPTTVNGTLHDTIATAAAAGSFLEVNYLFSGFCFRRLCPTPCSATLCTTLSCSKSFRFLSSRRTSSSLLLQSPLPLAPEVLEHNRPRSAALSAVSPAPAPATFAAGHTPYCRIFPRARLSL